VLAGGHKQGAEGKKRVSSCYHTPICLKNSHIYPVICSEFWNKLDTSEERLSNISQHLQRNIDERDGQIDKLSSEVVSLKAEREATAEEHRLKVAELNSTLAEQSTSLNARVKVR